MKSSIKVDLAYKTKMTAHSSQNYIFAHLCSVGEKVCLFPSCWTQVIGCIQVAPTQATEPLAVVSKMQGVYWSSFPGLCAHPGQSVWQKE